MWQNMTLVLPKLHRFAYNVFKNFPWVTLQDPALCGDTGWGAEKICPREPLYHKPSLRPCYCATKQYCITTSNDIPTYYSVVIAEELLTFSLIIWLM